MIIHGRKSICNLRFSVKLMRNELAFSSAIATATATATDLSLTVSYLTKSFGLTTKLAETITKKVNTQNNNNPNTVLTLLKTYGFTTPQISTILTTYPQLLTLDAESSLTPKLHLLKSKAASTEILSQVPKIFAIKNNNSIITYYDFIKDIIQETNKTATSAGSTMLENKIRNVSILRELGVSPRFLLPMLISDGKPVCGKEKFQESLKKVVNMGFDPESSKFVQALCVFYQLTDKTIEERYNVYKKFGFCESDVSVIFKKWPPFLSYSEKKLTQTFASFKSIGLVEGEEVVSVLKKHPKCICYSEGKVMRSVDGFLELGFSRDDVVMMVKSFPQCMDFSVELVKRKTQFLVEEMNWSVKGLVLIPQVLGYSLEKRIVPRCNVIKAIMSKGLMEERPPMSSVLTSTEKAFLRRYVVKYEEIVPELMAIFNRK